MRPPVININSENPTVALSADNLGSPVHVSGAEVTKIVLKEAKSRTDLEPAVNGQAVTTNYYERTFKIKVGETEYTLFSNERYDGEIADITELSVGDTVSFDGFVNIKENAYNLAMLSNVARVASEKDPVASVSIKGNNKVYAGKIRFYGIDTPESTGNVEPYGKQASNFTKAKLEEADANGTIVISSQLSNKALTTLV